VKEDGAQLHRHHIQHIQQQQAERQVQINDDNIRNLLTLPHYNNGENNDNGYSNCSVIEDAPNTTSINMHENQSSEPECTPRRCEVDTMKLARKSRSRGDYMYNVSQEEIERGFNENLDDNVHNLLEKEDFYNSSIYKNRIGNDNADYNPHNIDIRDGAIYGGTSSYPIATDGTGSNGNLDNNDNLNPETFKKSYNITNAIDNNDSDNDHNNAMYSDCDLIDIDDELEGRLAPFQHIVSEENVYVAAEYLDEERDVMKKNIEVYDDEPIVNGAISEDIDNKVGVLEPHSSFSYNDHNSHERSHQVRAILYRKLFWLRTLHVYNIMYYFQYTFL
jgi:hypothetical protein